MAIPSSKAGPDNARLSIEHEAFRLALQPRELDLCRRLGREESPQEIAAYLCATPQWVGARIRALQDKLTGPGERRKTVVGLAIFGYYLLRFESGTL